MSNALAKNVDTPIGANQATKPVTESPEKLAKILEGVSPLALALAAVHMSGSLDIIRSGPRPKPPARHADQTGSLPPEEVARIRTKAIEIIRAWRDAGYPEPYMPPQAELHEMINYLLGLDFPAGYVPMIMEDMAFEGTDPRTFRWTKPVSEADKKAHPVVIIGSGMSGLLIALRLKEAGIPFTVIEKNESVGGTWFENQYPGLRVDVPSHAYSFSFQQDHRWSHLYSLQPDLLAYFRKCAERFGVMKHIRFGVEVAGANWNDAKAMWEVNLVHRDGKKETVTARSLVSCVGFLNRPQIPEFPGAKDFKGVAFHSAQWRHDVSLAGKKVIVVGNAATGSQAIPQIAEMARHLTVFQRSAGWCLVNPEYDRTIRDAEQWAIEHLPFYAGWVRTLVFNWAQDLMPGWMQVDPNWPQDGKSVSALNAASRNAMVADMERIFADRPDLYAKLLPNYPPFVKRPAITTGNFFEAFKRDNVTLVTEGIDRIVENGIRDKTGRVHEADVIVYATGFQVQKFLTPMVIKGKGGEELNAYWKDRPGGHYGITVPHFPNFYMMYGPGTNLGYQGNLIHNSELQAGYIARCIRLAIEEKRERLEVKEVAFDDYLTRTGEKLKQFVWSTSYGTTYFRNAAGRVTTNTPWSLLEMWTWLKEPDPANFC